MCFINTLEQSNVLMALIHTQCFINFLSRILVGWKVLNELISYQVLNTADKFLSKLLTSQNSVLSGMLPSSNLKKTKFTEMIFNFIKLFQVVKLRLSFFTLEISWYLWYLYATKPSNLSENVVTQALPTLVTDVKNRIHYFHITI